MYVAKRFTASSSVHLETEFDCARCGHHREVEVTAGGQGSGDSPFFLDHGGAVKRARKHAHQVALSNADLALGLAPCPRCGHRNALTKFWVHTVLALLGVGGGFFAFGALLDAARPGIGSWIFGGLGIAGVFFILYLRWTQLRSAPRQVVFHAAEPERRRKKQKKPRKPKPTAEAPPG